LLALFTLKVDWNAVVAVVGGAGIEILDAATFEVFEPGGGGNRIGPEPICAFGLLVPIVDSLFFYEEIKMRRYNSIELFISQQFNRSSGHHQANN
jgi:hypothetical protein